MNAVATNPTITVATPAGLLGPGLIDTGRFGRWFQPFGLFRDSGNQAMKFTARTARWIASLLFAGCLSACAQTVENETPASRKHVVIDKTRQMLRAYEGDRLVLESRVSTGRRGRWTPNGNYKVGVKWRMHYSRLYDNAPMPYSVQVSGNYFIHGFHSVPDYPASHGCIRLPLSGENPAKQFFDWVDPGTPVRIVGEWQGK